jgi:hypothetical protein
MTLGFRVRDAATGQVKLEVTDRLTRVIGKVDTGISNGAMDVPGFATGTPWAVIMQPISSLSEPADFSTPAISGTTLSWSFIDNTTSKRRSVTIIYGVY